MNKRVILALATALTPVVALAPGAAMAASTSATDSGSANAIVVAPITLTHTGGAALNFGKFTVGTGGSVSVSTVGVGTAGGSVTFVSGSAPTADTFSVTGDPSRSFVISTSGGTISAGSTAINFTTNPSSAGATLDTTGAASFSVGGILTLAGTEPGGSYAGSYSATVSYN